MMVGRRSVLRAALAALGSAAAAPAWADPDPPSAPPGIIRGAEVAIAADLKDLMDRGERVIVIDARRMGRWEKGHIPGALKSSWKPNFILHAWTFDAKALGNDKAARIVVYGEDATDGWAGQAVQKAVAEGFTNVMWLRGGMAEWIAARMPTAS